MTPPIFNLGDEVETTNGTRFKISQIWKRTDGSFAYSDPNRRWFHADDLRLVPDELKIGDWVKVIGPDVALNDYYRGRRFRISQTPCQMSDMFSCEFYPNYFPAKSLRKLTPDEIADCTAPNLELSQEMKVKIGMTFLKHLDQIGELQDRLKQHDEEIKGIYDILENHEEIHEGMDERLSTIEKRLAFVEKFQRDQSDLVGRAIRDGVAEILDFRRKA